MSTASALLSRSRDPVSAKVFGGVDYKYELLHVLVDASGSTITPSSGVSVTVPANGAVVLQVALSTSAVPVIVVNGYTTYLNSGVALNSNSLYEFIIHVANGDTITILTSATATASVLRVFFKYNM